MLTSIHGEAAGLVSSKTKEPGGFLVNLDRASCALRRVKSLKRSVWASGTLHSVTANGQRPAVPWFVTLTYADPDAWRPNHIKDAINLFRKWCKRASIACKYTWVAEIQPKRAKETGRHVVHYHLIAWLPVDVSMPFWDKKVTGSKVPFWVGGMSNTKKSTAGVGYLMKYMSKLGEFTQFPKGLRLYGIGGLNAQSRSIRSWLNLPQWCKCSHGVGDLIRVAGRLVVQATGEILSSPYIVSLVPGGLIVRLTRAIPEAFHAGPYSTFDYCKLGY